MTEQKLALITGANKGIGFEMSRQLAGKGVKVLMGGRNMDRVHAAVEKLQAEGLDVQEVQIDVTDSDQIASLKEKITGGYGHLDILINNAGIAHQDEPLFANSAATVPIKAVRETFDVNFFGLVELTQSLLPLIRKSPAGRIVNMSSMLGSMGLHTDPGAGIDQIKPLAYDASKAAVNMFTIHLAAQLKDTPIKVNSAHPGWVKTDMGGDEAPMEVEDGAKTGVTLALLGDDGPSGGFFHMGEAMPW